MITKVNIPLQYKETKKIIYILSLDLGIWRKDEYNSEGNKTYSENSSGCTKYEYDTEGNKIYYQNKNGYCHKREFDSRGKETYFENSNGYIRNDRKIKH